MKNNCGNLKPTDAAAAAVCFSNKLCFFCLFSSILFLSLSVDNNNENSKQTHQRS